MDKSESKNSKRIGLLTGGGDCPGLNAAIRAVVMKGMQLGYEVVGIKNGWKGLMGETDTKVMAESDIEEILDKGGTILGSGKINPAKIENGIPQIESNFRKLKLEGVIAIGGDGTLAVGQKFPNDFPIIAVPKTIDNDVEGTDFCIGFWTAVQTATEALDKLHSTAESHSRVMVLEVMGRDFGWIATYAGLAGGADFILVPEEPVDIDEVCRMIKERIKKGKNFCLIVVSEGVRVKKTPGLKKIPVELCGAGNEVAGLISEKMGVETRSVNIGHILRGGSPCAFDRILGTRLGIKAMEEASKKRFRRAVVLRGDSIVSIPFEEIKGGRKVNPEVYDAAETFFN
jgi:6-phosphofructokinase 1